MRIRPVLLSSSLFLLLAGCPPGEPPPDGGDPSPVDDAGDLDDGDAGTDAGGSSEEDGGVDAGSQPEADAGPADLAARLLYINQRVFREDDFFARGGTAALELHTPQPLPADDRSEWFNADGERCTLESGSEWPTDPPGGSPWPAGPFYDAGDLTLTVATAPGPVVYEYFDSYYLRKSPGPVQLGNITYNSFYPPEYIPHGQAAELSAPGGADVGAFSFDGVALAADYTVSAPDLETGNDVIDTNAALTFSWSPAAPGDTMAVIVKDSFSFVKCVFDDDGEGTVPAEAMAQLNGGQFVRVTIQTWREHTEKVRATAADDTELDVTFTSRHVQIGRFDSQ